MFNTLTLKHFKTWRDAVTLELAPVTMVLGTNSSGKSSLLQALLLLKQTVASPDRAVHLNLGGDELNDYFSFGQFDDVLTCGATPRQFELGFGFQRDAPPDGQPVSAVPIRSGMFSAVYAMTASGATVVQSLKLQSEGSVFRVVRRERGAYSVFVNEEQQPRGKSRAYAPERSIALSTDAVQLLGRDGKIAEDISLAIRRELETIAYLGPLRRKPERDYVWNKSRPGEMAVDGSNAIDVLFSSALGRANNDGHQHLIAEVSTWLNRMKLAERLEVRQLGRSTRYEIVVHKDGVAANLRDVGIGVSQVLPVLALAQFAPSGSTVILEEPEIHLHPLAQAALAELFVEVSRKRRIQFIIETHSEHLFRRLQTLIAREEVRPDDCRLYFVERDQSDASLTELTLDPFGRVTQWPEGFFGDALGETREQSRLMFERQQRERQP